MHSLNSSRSTAQTQSQISLKSGISQHESGNFQEAIKHYSKAIKLNPNKPNAYYNLGLVYKNIKKYDLSIKCLKTAIEKDPHYIEAYVNLGNVYKKQKNYIQAEKQYKSAIQCDANNIAALTNLALLYKHLGKFENAQKIFNQMVQKEPHNSANYNNLGVIQKNSKKYEPAFLNLKKAIELNPEFADAYYNMGVLSASMNNFAEAEDYLRKADNLKNNDPLIQTVRAVNLNKLNQAQEAFKLLRKINDLISSDSLEAIEKRTNIRKVSLKWIKVSLDQLNSLTLLNQQKSRMSIEQKKQLTDINNSFFHSFEDAEKKQGQNQTNAQLVKRVKQLQMQVMSQGIQLNDQGSRINKCEQKLQNMEQDIKKLKKEIQWDERFDELLKQQPQYAQHYQTLYAMLCTSIQSYRAVKSGIVAGGGGIMKSEFGKIIQKVNSIMGLASKLPFVGRYCEILSHIGQAYLANEADYVCTQIVGSTKNLYNDKKLTKAISQAIIFLSKQPEYLELLQVKAKQQKIWHEKIIARFQKVKQLVVDKNLEKLLTKATQMGGHNISDELNKVMGQCAQIILNMIKEQNSSYVKKAQNPLLAASQIWVKNLRTIEVKVHGAVFQDKTGFFSKKTNYFCKLVYGQQSAQTQVYKSGEPARNWKNCEFTFQKKRKLEQIVFQVYDKAYFLGKDKLVGSGWIFDTTPKQKIHSVQLSCDNLPVGYVEVEIL